MELCLRSTNLTDEFRIGINPFTREEVRFPLDNGLTELQLASVRKYLTSIGAYSAEDDTYVYVPLKNGETLHIGAPALLNNGNPVSYSLDWKSISSQLAEILFNLCVESGMVLQHEIDSVLCFSKANIELVHLRWKNIKEIRHSEQLLEWLLEKYC